MSELVMPSGKTHDRITWLCMPWVTLGAMLLSRQWSLGLMAGVGFLFGGLMFGPDLDVRSRQTRRWGWLAWIWYPYRKWLRHRSWLSHGPIVGTVIRLLYLALWLTLLGLAGLEMSNRLGYTTITWEGFWYGLKSHLGQYRYPWLMLILGIETGAMSHSLSDWIVSAWKRRRSRKVAKSSPQLAGKSRHRRF